ncbi:MAG: type II secretion system F family protein [Candidatus Pacebacteria bacterium]|nr:type II secretion system F family protein [Candidatus Paceibacterota bacterium]
MNYKYDAVTDKGEKKSGLVEAPNQDMAISALQKRGLIVLKVIEEGAPRNFLEISLFESVKTKEVVIMSRQIATLFEANVSALKAFQLLSTNSENRLLTKKLMRVTEDLQAGVSISEALAKHPDVFSSFYVNMVRSGEESGNLTTTFNYLAEYLDRQYALTSKTKNALIYPGFVIGIFFVVMILMFTMIIPKLSEIILSSGQDVPVYTKVVIGISNIMVNYGIFMLAGIVAIFSYLFYLAKTKSGKKTIDELKIKVPVFGPLFRKVYLARIADNLDTMLSSGIPIVRAIQITSDVVGNEKYQEILIAASEEVKAGSTLSQSLSKYEVVPQILVQMMKVGEETGSLGQILKTLARFYKREVDDAVDTLVSLIEPVMIVALGLGVGLILVSVLMPIYDIAGGIS